MTTTFLSIDDKLWIVELVVGGWTGKTGVSSSPHMTLEYLLHNFFFWSPLEEYLNLTVFIPLA